MPKYGMRTIDTIYEAWQKEQWDQPEPAEIEECYRHFRKVLYDADIKVGIRGIIWDAMTECQQKAAEIAFKEGYRMGFRLHDELAVEDDD